MQSKGLSEVNGKKATSQGYSQPRLIDVKIRPLKNHAHITKALSTEQSEGLLTSCPNLVSELCHTWRVI